MAPQLSLDYNSQAGNGPLGIGLSLGGLSAITRCPMTLAQDGAIDPVDLDSNDRYCLDGQRLIAVTNTGCTGGNEYRTEIDSYARICSVATAGAGPAWFKVWTKAGHIMVYGQSVDSRIEAQGSTTVLVWAANRIQDAAGNYLNVSYYEDNATGEYRPERIDYAGNAAQGMPPYHAVQFVYEQRPDQAVGWVGGSAMLNRMRMSRVQIYAGYTMIREYGFSYGISTSNNRSLLASVTECSGDGVCLPETELQWASSTNYFANDGAWMTGAYASWAGAGARIHDMDTNGDGLSDIVIGPNASGQWFVMQANSTGSGFVDRGAWISGAYGDWGGAADRIHVMDVTGDGLSDIVLGPNAYGQWFVMQNTGSAFVNKGAWISGAYAEWAPATSRIHIMDTNGDGRSDVVLGPNANGQWFVMQSTGTSFVNKGAWISGAYGTWDGAADRIRLMDTNGDGLSDIVLGPDANGQWFVMQSTGTSFVNKGAWISGVYGSWAGAASRIRVMDTNGDNLSDIVLGPNTSGQWFVMQSTGTGFVNKGAWISNAYGGWETAADRIRVMDTNGDGLSDIVLGPNASGQWFVMQSTGSSFINKGAWISGAYANWTAASDRVRIMDVNGDGFSDIVLGPDASGNWFVLKNGTGLIDHMTSATQGDGAFDTITYKMLTNGSVYTRGTVAVAYPQQRIQPPLKVVSSVSASNGVGGTNVRRYTYSDARVDVKGRGFLGYRTVTEIDDRSQIQTLTTYSQTFPYVGLGAAEDTRRINATAPLKTSSNGWNNVSPYTGVYQVRNASTTEKTFELDGSLVSTVSTGNTQFDSYGNPGQVTVTAIGGGETYTKTTANTYDNDIVQWHLGRLLSSSVTSSGPGGVDTRTSSFEYDPLTGLLNVEIIEPYDPQLLLRTEYGYDGYGNKASVIVRDSGGNGYPIATASSSTNYDYSALAGYGTYTITSSNAKGQTETQVIDARFGKPLSMTGPNGLVTQWQYDSFGNQIKEIRADGTQTTISMTWCNSSCANGLANTVYRTTTQASGAPSITVYYDSLDRERRSQTVNLNGAIVYKDTQYNALAQTARISRPYFSTDTAQWTDYQYDALGRAWKETSSDGGIVETTYAGLTTSVRRYSVNDSYNQAVTRIANVEGNLVQVIDEGLRSTYYQYDPFGSLTRVTDPANNVTAMSYDRRGRKLTMDDPDMGHWEYRYDALGQLRWQKDAKNQIATMSYDVLGRMIERVDPEGANTWVYDEPGSKGIGKLWIVGGPDGYRETHRYDSMGRPSEIAYTIGGTIWTTSAQYDSFSRLSTSTYPSGFKVKHGYTANGYLSSVSNASNTGEVYWTAQEAAPDGQITSELLGNGAQTVRTVDPQSGRMTYLGTYAGANTVQVLTYRYDSLGNLSAREDGSRSLSETFQYDAYNRLTRAAIAGVGNKVWSYDDLGNITSKDGYTDYTYGTAGNQPHAVKTARGQNYSYDSNGNMTAGGGRTITWNSRNLPTRIVQVDTDVSFGYTPDGARYRQISIDGGYTKTTLYIGGLYEHVSKYGVDTEKVYIQAAGRLVAIRERETASGAVTLKYLHQDHLGSTDVITGADGQVLERQSFDAFGTRRMALDWRDPVGLIASNQSTRGYTGHEQLDNLGLIHMNGRIYDPQLGRFLSADPVVKYPEGAQGLNRYSYVDNNPLSRVDPSGYGWLSKAWKSVKKAFDNPIVRAIAAIAVAAFAYAYVGLLTSSSFWGTVAGGFAGGVVSTGTLQGGLIGAASALMFYPLHGMSSGFGKTLAHGAVGGVRSRVLGGSFREGFLSASFTQAAGSRIDRIGRLEGRLAAAAVVGGTAAELGGGKFANGAVTGAFSRLFNGENLSARRVRNGTTWWEPTTTTRSDSATTDGLDVTSFPSLIKIFRSWFPESAGLNLGRVQVEVRDRLWVEKEATVGVYVDETGAPYSGNDPKYSPFWMPSRATGNTEWRREDMDFDTLGPQICVPGICS